MHYYLFAMMFCACVYVRKYLLNLFKMPRYANM